VIGKFHMKVLLMIPGINTILFRKIREKLVAVFGGKFREIVVGGARSTMKRKCSSGR
jgi:hypothetical protein